MDMAKIMICLWSACISQHNAEEEGEKKKREGRKEKRKRPVSRSSQRSL